MGAERPRVPGSLPLLHDSFAGRATQLRELEPLVAEAAVVTLVGTGGVGKTRLALELAHRSREGFPDGVWLVDLSATAVPGQVIGEVAAVLGVAVGATDPVALLVEQLRDRRTLLVLDNCEHLVGEVAALVHRLTGACRGLRVLATSREPLALAAEVRYPVPPLDVEGEAVQLLTDRAWAAGSRVPLDAAERAEVVALCARLDGLPLAIELAAPWVRVLSPGELLSRLENRSELLTAVRRDVPDRQRTMRATVDWSHRLLTEPERVLFRRLAVFQGTFGVEAVERICGGEPLGSAPVVGPLADLVDRSLVVAERGAAGPGRLRMLVTLRDFAAERLRESGELDELRRRHFAHWLDVAERVDAERLWRGSDAGVAALLPEGDDLRAALDWAIEHDPPGALRLAAALEGFWMVRSVREGAHRVRRALDRAPEPTRFRARALMVSPLVVAGGLPWPEARGLVEDGIALFTSLEDEVGAALARLMLVLAAFFTGRLDEAGRWAEEAVERHAGLAHPLFHARAETYAGGVRSFTPRRLEEGRRRLAEGASRSHAAADGWGEGLALMLLGLADLRAGEPEPAHEHLRAAIQLELQAGVTAAAIGGLGHLAIDADPRRACTLLEAAAAVLERTGVPRFPPQIERQLAGARRAAERRLSRPVAERCRAAARAMTTAEVIAYALERTRPVRLEADRLTARQQEVALLVAEGLTNREIAERLRLSVRTVESHVDGILSELGFHSRSRLAAWVRDSGLTP